LVELPFLLAQLHIWVAGFSSPAVQHAGRTKAFYTLTNNAKAIITASERMNSRKNFFVETGAQM